LKDGFVPGGPYTDPTYTPELCPPRWKRFVRDLYASPMAWSHKRVERKYEEIFVSGQ
jgi:hypothetical protein